MSTIDHQLELFCITLSHQDEVNFGSLVIFNVLYLQKTGNLLIRLIFQTNLLLR